MGKAIWNKFLAVIVSVAFIMSTCSTASIAYAADINELRDSDSSENSEKNLAEINNNDITLQKIDFGLNDENGNVQGEATSTKEYDKDVLGGEHRNVTNSNGEMNLSEANNEHVIQIATEVDIVDDFETEQKDDSAEHVFAEFVGNGAYCSNISLGNVMFDTEAYPALHEENGIAFSELVNSSFHNGDYLYLKTVVQNKVQTAEPASSNLWNDPDNNTPVTKVRYHDGAWQCDVNGWKEINPANVTVYYRLNIKHENNDDAFSLDISAADWPYTQTKWMNPLNGVYSDADAPTYNAIPKNEYDSMSDPAVVIYQVYDENGIAMSEFSPVYTYYWGCGGNKAGNKIEVKSDTSIYGIDEIRVQPIGRVPIVANQAYSYAPANLFDDIVDYYASAGEKIDASGTFTIPFGKWNEGKTAGSNTRTNACLIAVKVYQMVPTTYTVKHIVDGIEMTNDTKTYEEMCRLSNGTSKIRVSADSIAPNNYAGYAYDSVNTKANEVDNGTVIELSYIKDEAQVRNTSYTVIHNVAGEIKDSKTYWGTAWICDDPAIIEIDANSVVANFYKGYKFSSIDIDDDAREVVDGTVITLTYVDDMVEVVVEFVDENGNVVSREIGNSVRRGDEYDVTEESNRVPSGYESNGKVEDVIGIANDDVLVKIPVKKSFVEEPVPSDPSEPVPTQPTQPSYSTPTDISDDGEPDNVASSNDSSENQAVIPNTTTSDANSGDDGIIGGNATLPQATEQNADGDNLMLFENNDNIEYDISDEETALAGFGIHAPHCWTHWLMILGGLLTIVYCLAVIYRRRRDIHDLDDFEDDVRGHARKEEEEKKHFSIDEAVLHGAMA